MNRLSTKTPVYDPFTTVMGLHGIRYACPDRSAVDEHLVGLCHRIEHATPHFPHLIEAYRVEIDLLLDRRWWLELADEVCTGEAGAEEVVDAA